MIYNEKIKSRHTRVMEKLKTVRNTSSSEAIKLAIHSGSGQVVTDYYNKLVSVYGETPFIEALHFEEGSTSIP